MTQSDAVTSAPTHGPLAGLRILDLTSVVLGPLATQILGDYGADIIKIEALKGDLMRANGVRRNAGMTSIFLTLNRNKRSLALDLKKPEGAAVLRRLITSADVLVHNMRVSAIERLGFGYKAVSAIKPDIVYCVATGFDQTGPDRDKPAFDDVIQAACGLAMLNATESETPHYVPSLIADKTTGLVLVNAVLAALFHRERHGVGQYVEVPMFETMVAFILTEHLGGLAFDPPAGPAGYSRLLAGGRRPAATKDGHIAMLPYTGAHWRAFYQIVGREDLAEAYGVDDRLQRNQHLVAMYADMDAMAKHRTTAQWMEICTQLDIPATPLYTMDELPTHPQIKAVNLIEDMHHEREGAIRQVRPSTLFSATPAGIARQAPQLGQQSHEILREVGFSEEEIGALERSAVVAGPG